MKITYELDLETFEAWSGTVGTLDRVRNAGKCAQLEAALELDYPEGMTEGGLNDLLWFEPEWVYEVCGIRTEEKIRAELEEKQDELEELKENYEEEVEEQIDEINSSRELAGMNELDEEEIESLKTEIWSNNYKSDADDLEEEISDLEEELKEW